MARFSALTPLLTRCFLLWDAVCCYQYNCCSAYTKPKAFQLLILPWQGAGWWGGRKLGRDRTTTAEPNWPKGYSTLWGFMLNTPLLRDGVGGEQLHHSSPVLHHYYCYHFLFSWPIKLSSSQPINFYFFLHFSPPSHSWKS